MDTEKQKADSSAEARYRALTSERQHYLRRAHECAKLTIPSLVPTDNDQSKKNEDHELEQPWQSVGSIGVNTLAAKMLLTILPPNTPFFMFAMGRTQRAQLTGMDPAEADKLATKIDTGLRKMETEVVREIEAGTLRTVLFGVLKHLLVAGNVLLYLGKEPKAYPLNRYVIERDPSGNTIRMVIREIAAKSTLDPAFLAAIPNEHKDPKSQVGPQNIEVYTVVERAGPDKWDSWQEVYKTRIPGTYGSYSDDSLAWVPLRMIAVDGEDYGRSYVEELYGDLLSADSLTKASVQGAMIMARLLWMVNPNGLTDSDDIQEAANGDIIEGRAEDVTALQANKYADFQIADKALERILVRLERAFLMASSAQRNGDRVTAFEIQKLTQEIEDTLGGYYSILAQELQLPIVKRTTAMMQRSSKLPKFPKGSIEPMIITGISALGRGQDLNRLRGFLGDLEVAQKAGLIEPGRVSGGELIDRLALGHMVDTAGLVKSDEELQAAAQAQQQQAMQQELVSKATGPAINALSKAQAQGNK